MLTAEPKAPCLRCEYIFEAKVSRRVSRDVDAKYDAVTTGFPEVVSVFRSESKLAGQLAVNPNTDLFCLQGGCTFSRFNTILVAGRERIRGEQVVGF